MPHVHSTPCASGFCGRDGSHGASAHRARGFWLLRVRETRDVHTIVSQGREHLNAHSGARAQKQWTWGMWKHDVVCIIVCLNNAAAAAKRLCFDERVQLERV